MKKTYLLLIAFILLVSCTSTSDTPTPPTHISPTAQSSVIPPTSQPVPSTPTVVATPEPGSYRWEVEYREVLFEDFDGSKVSSALSFSPYGEAVFTNDPNQVISGDTSVRLSNYGFIATNPELLPLRGNETYIVQFDYKILQPSTEEDSLYFFFIPQGSENTDTYISVRPMLHNTETSGIFSVGARLADASTYYFILNSSEHSSVLIDNIKILHQNTIITIEQPKSWAKLSTIPYPRLGNYLQGATFWIAYGMGGEEPFTYSMNEIEKRLAFSDVIAGFDMSNQGFDPDFARRMRALNPNIILLPYRIAQEDSLRQEPTNVWLGIENYDPEYEFSQGISDEWIVKTTSGDPARDPDWVDIKKMNIYDGSPVVNGQTYNDYLTNWVVGTVMESGLWDGIFFDNLFGSINPHIENAFDPARLDFDVNRNGIRDETPASINGLTRKAAIGLLEQLRDEFGSQQIIMGNTGPLPEIYLAPYVNGYIFECADEAWEAPWLAQRSEAGWRRALESYFEMQQVSMSPSINIIEGCGHTGGFVEPDRRYQHPSEEDLRVHRFTLGTALLGDGFYEYDLFDARSAPYWFDEYTVDNLGVAVEDIRYKGYLGAALGDAIELKSPATFIWNQDFETNDGSSLRFADISRTYLSTNSTDSILGNSSLVLYNGDHSKGGLVSIKTNPSRVVISPSGTYMLEFDWEILENLDGRFAVEIGSNRNRDPGVYYSPGIVAGDSGRAVIPFTNLSGAQTIDFQIIGGGGKVAIDNITLTQGGVGPWRRDFENGFVLVNPLNKPHTFTLEELAGNLMRTGIKRILGTQSPDVNNGEQVLEPLTLDAFEAIILLADPMIR